MPTWPEGTEPSSIEWLPVLGGPTVEVVPADMEEQLLPLDVADLAGRTVVVYQRRSGVVDPCGGTAWLPGVEIDEGNCGTFALWSLLDHTEAQDLDSDRHWYLGQTGGWEWGATVRVGGDLAAIVPAYDWERDTLLVTDIDDVTATGMFRSPECSRPCPEIDPEVRCPGYNGPVIHIISPVFSPDGTRLAFMESHSYSCDEYEGGTDIVVFDPFTLEELHRSETDGSSLLDFNGDYLLFSDALVSIQPGIKDVGLPEANHYSFWTVGSDS